MPRENCPLASPERSLVYRDRPLPDDTVGARTVERVARALAPGGRGYVLCNWIERRPAAGRGEGAWLEPVRRWVAGLGRDAVIVRVADLDPGAYATVWTRDLPEGERPVAIARWTNAYAAEGIERIHVGVIALARRRRIGTSGARVTALDGRTQRVTWQAVEDGF
jgi:hypothetical protein